MSIEAIPNSHRDDGVRTSVVLDMKTSTQDGKAKSPQSGSVPAQHEAHIAISQE